MNLQPSISVILPVYNGGEYLKHSVESVLKQTYTNFEFLIVDDSSTDGSWEYLTGINDARVKAFRNVHNKGLFYNLNDMVKRAESPLIKLWAQDDIMYPECLSGFVSFHSRFPHVGFSYCARDIINEKGEIEKYYKEDLTPEIISTEMHALISFEYGSIAGNIANVCITRNAFNTVGLYNEEMKISADFEMQVRIAEHFPTGFIRDALIQLRDHDKQLSRDARYYIYHVKEDLQIFKFLLGYVDDKTRKKGKQLLRKQKLMFYYTLMLKSIRSGNISLAKKYYTLLSSFDNFALLTWCFMKYVLKKSNK